MPQLEIWADRVGVDIVVGKENADPSSVVYDGVSKAKNEGYDLLICDTAGRLTCFEKLDDPKLRKNNMHIDLERAKTLPGYAQCFACFTTYGEKGNPADLFEKQLAFGVDEYVFNFNAKNDSINQKFFAEPFLSCFCRDCIGRGLDINCGGSIYF